MTTTDQQIKAKLEQFKSRYWTEQQLAEWYELDFSDAPTQKILVQVGWFAGTYESPSTFGQGPFDHWHFEKFLQRRELVPITEAAARLAISVSDFRIVAENFSKSPLWGSVGYPWAFDSNCIVRGNFLRDFHKGFERLRRSQFGNYPSYIQRIHAEIRDVLGVSITSTVDKTDQALGISPPDPGYEIDCLTNEPIGMGHEIALDTPKPIELAPDYCSWFTFAKHQDVLGSEMLGTLPGLDEEMLKRLKESDDH